MIGIFKSVKTWVAILISLIIVGGIVFVVVKTVKASKEAFENRFQKPYTEKRIKPYLDSLKTEREQFQLVYNELDTVSKQLFSLESDYKSVVMSLQNTIKHQKDNYKICQNDIKNLETGVRVDLVTLTVRDRVFGKDKLVDSTYQRGWRWGN